ncbi:hypothetical protein [Mesorhizobium sp.]|uniref:hypothetical protein n=1 Tax=Mesorhizobium sp. TaxID=1871066 RepID=UPI000FE74EE9|nr:hypothetical protein [Mesorhizobium sp.]RWN58738.1 MAG: hypothetical protein EOS00_20325 [Mesorhizobium sp.]
MLKFKPTFDFAAYRIHDVIVGGKPDFLPVSRVNASSIRNPKNKIELEFLGSRNARFKALISACRVKRPDIEDLFGRVFAMKNGGANSEDFVDLEYASAWLQSDRTAFEQANAYVAACRAEESAEAAGFDIGA